MPILFSLALAVVLAASPALAQSTYTPWKNPDAPASGNQEKLQGFVDKLNAFVDEAEKARAADPQFLRDLRDLARGFDRPWRRVVLQDSFIDGNFTADPTWSVTAGEYWIEKGWGLRSAIEPGATQAPQSSSGGERLKGKDAAAAIIGSLLNQALKGQQGGGQATSPAAPAAPAEALIHTAVTLSNAFAIEFSMSSWAAQGRVEVAVFQGRYAGPERSAGYRLVYQPGGRLELLRTSSRGTGVVDSSAEALNLEDKKFHAFEWLRYADGRMTVSVDGREVLSTVDRGFRDSFAGIAIANRGGDYIMKQVKASATN